MSDGWQTEPHHVDPAIADAADRIAGMLPVAIREAAAIIESSPSGAVRLLTGFTEAQIDELGGMPTLSDSSDRVLRASEIVPDTWGALVARLSSSERRELFREMRP